MELRRKLEILADAAKYDASCASSGTTSRRAGRNGIGSTESSGICHSYTPDGRCVSLLKILLTNHCIFDCSYCINRRSSAVERARFTVAEVVDLTLSFYRRNYIEGLFLSSGIIRDPDYTMEQVTAVARTLREQHGFAGYIHLKAIPEASPELVEEAGRWADRVSLNVELPSQAELDRLASGKRLVQIEGSMSRIRERSDADAAETRSRSALSRSRPSWRPFAPAGQSTQMIVGATAASDRDVLARADTLYRRHRLRRVYYTGYSPIPDSAAALPAAAPPLLREHRLYQADWLLRFYGFDVEELFRDAPDHLPLRLDPKLAWALRNRGDFPVDVNADPRERLLRVPGLGVRNVDRILQARRYRSLRVEDLKRLQVRRRALHFLKVHGRRSDPRSLDSLSLEHLVAPPDQQLELFAAAAAAQSGEL